MTWRLLSMVAGLAYVAVGAAFGQDANVANSAAPNAAASAVWTKVHASVFANAPLEPAGDVITLDTPTRAEDAAIVPIAIRSRFPQTKERFIERVWLIVDNNPSPIAAVFNFTLESGRADIETRIRIEEYTHVRAVALTNDGKLSMAVNYVKASGGCSAPAGKDALAAKANLGKMRLRIDESAGPGRPALAQLMISHPNDSGLAMDQLTRNYAPPHFVRHVKVTHGGRPIMSAEVDFSISENPNFRFYFVPDRDAALEAKIVDNQDLEFASTTRLNSGAGSAASTLR